MKSKAIYDYSTRLIALNLLFFRIFLSPFELRYQKMQRVSVLGSQTSNASSYFIHAYLNICFLSRRLAYVRFSSLLKRKLIFEMALVPSLKRKHLFRFLCHFTFSSLQLHTPGFLLTVEFPSKKKCSLQISQKLYEPYLREVLLFKGCSLGFIKQIVSHFLPCKVVYMKDDVWCLFATFPLYHCLVCHLLTLVLLIVEISLRSKVIYLFYILL